MQSISPPVLPHLVHNLVDDELTRLVVLVCTLAMRICCRRSKQQYSIEDLQQIDSDIMELQQTLQTLYEGDINLQTAKFHKLGHLTTDIRSLGHPKHYNSDMWETAHVRDKRAYEMTTKKQRNQQYVGEVVNNLRLQDMYRAIDLATAASNGGQVSTHYLTALMKASRDSTHTMASSFDIISTDVLQRGESATRGMLNKLLAQRSLALRSLDVVYQHLPHRLREFMLGDQIGYGAAYDATNLPPLDPRQTIRVHKSAVLAADCPWDDESFVLQTVRTHSSFHGSPLYDSVAVWQAADDEQERAAARSRQGSRGRRRGRKQQQQQPEEQPAMVVGYAKLLLLFEVDLRDRQGVLRNRKLAYVQWYRVKQQDDPLCQAGAVALAWDMVNDPARRDVAGQTPRCGLIDLSSIIRREYVVRDYAFAAASGRFHVSPFNY